MKDFVTKEEGGQIQVWANQTQILITENKTWQIQSHPRPLPPAHLCAVAYMTEISATVTLSIN